MQSELRAFWYYTLGKYYCKTPPVLTLFVTNECNSHCQHCFYWKNLGAKKVRISLEQIEALSGDLGDLELLLISGGEPFLREDLAEIIKIFYENNHLKSTSIPTNCLTPQVVEKQVIKILKTCPKLLVVIPLSLDGDEETHDQIRGIKGNFKKVQETYLRLIKLKEKYPNLRIRINATIFDRNYKGLFKLIDHLPELFPDCWTLSLCLMRGDPRNRNLELPNIKEIRKLFDYKDEKFKGKRPWNYVFLERVIMSAQIKILQEKKQFVPCESGRLLAVVHEDGTLGHCEDWGGEVGNLKEESFAALWQGKRARYLRNKIERKDCYCTHEICLFTSLLAHPLGWLKLLFSL